MRAIPIVAGQASVSEVQQKTSVVQALNGNVEVATAIGVDSNNWANNFAPANMTGVSIRIGATGNLSPAGYQWAASSADLQISHGLGRVPIGFLVIYKNKTCDVWAGTTKPDNQFLTLQTSDASAETTIWIF